MCGFSSSTCSEGTRVRCRICSNTFVTLATPAALSRWPMFDLTDPMVRRTEAAGASAKALRNPSISIGSPSDVPVP